MSLRALEVLGFKHYLSGPSDHPVDAPDGTSQSMLSSRISRNIFIRVLVWVACLYMFMPGDQDSR
jgi:hypothetical protein